jgi:hypothetical protein
MRDGDTAHHHDRCHQHHHRHHIIIIIIIIIILLLLLLLFNQVGTWYLCVQLMCSSYVMLEGKHL